jgi:hypothetical protein
VSTGALHFARLTAAPEDARDFARLRAALEAANPGYTLRYEHELRALAPAKLPRLVFVQSASGARATLRAENAPPSESALAVGDLVLLRPEDALAVEGSVSALVFESPTALGAELPAFVRPDHDPRITDKPGGCAEEEDAYRRILLTWLPEKGAYVHHGLNAHRVRIRDSFTHYHPRAGGFDELYLVQGAQSGARLIYSERVERIERAGDVTREEALTLMQQRALAPGDLVYMPRGTAHRGFGDLVVQVIALPGFRPGAEIGLDHHLRELDRRLELPEDERLPFNAAAAMEEVIK